MNGASPPASETAALPGRLSGKLAVVTGATRGIGHAIAVRLRADGARVIGTGTSPDATRVPSGCEYRQVDLVDLADTERFGTALWELAPDILVNNAGLNKLSLFSEIRTDDFERIQAINVRAPLLLCRAVLPGMCARGFGWIVNVCSIWGKTSIPGRGAYSASKFGVAGFSAALAAEAAASNIVVNCVSPGFIDTEMLRGVQSREAVDALVADVPMRRLGRCEEVAALVAWLASPENTFTTGQNIAIDGGYTGF